MPLNRKFIAIVGPTAAGKTVMAIELAKEFSGEIICADSRTVYEGMDIGTAKPSKIQQKVVKHHLLDVITLDKPYSVAQFKKEAKQAMQDIRSRDKIPFLVGLSGLYVDSVLYNYSFRNTESSEEIARIQSMSLLELQQKALAQYSNEFSKIDQKNRRRVEQLLTKGPAKDSDRNHAKIKSLVLGIDVKIPTIKQNIAKRTELMLNNGFVQEVQTLVSKYGTTDILTHTTGYKEVLEYLNGTLTIDQLKTAINTKTYQLSRKQMTWFRRNPNICWIHKIDDARKLIQDYLQTP